MSCVLPGPAGGNVGLLMSVLRLRGGSREVARMGSGRKVNDSDTHDNGATQAEVSPRSNRVSSEDTEP